MGYAARGILCYEVAVTEQAKIIHISRTRIAVSWFVSPFITKPYCDPQCDVALDDIVVSFDGKAVKLTAIRRIIDSLLLLAVIPTVV